MTRRRNSSVSSGTETPQPEAGDRGAPRTDRIAGASQSTDRTRRDRKDRRSREGGRRKRMKILENLYYHPIFVHFPQALFPVSFLSFVLYLATGAREFEVEAFITALFAPFPPPITTFTGFLDWKIRYKGYMTSVFRIKIIGAFSLFGFAVR